MAQLKLRVKKAGSKNPVNKQLGLTARVLTNGTADFDDIVKDAGRNTTMHKAELRMAFELCLDEAGIYHRPWTVGQDISELHQQVVREG